MYAVVAAQAAALAALLGGFAFLERSAAMRGTKGEDNLPPWAHRLMRLLFLLVLVGPFLAALPSAIVLLVLYLPSFLDLSELHGGRPSEFVRSLPIWGFPRWYFSLRLAKTAELRPEQRYLIALEPHGILPFGGVLNLVSGKTSFNKLFPGIELRGLAASFCFYIPLYREVMLAAGICDASRYSADRCGLTRASLLADASYGSILRSGKSLFLVPGGATEALYADPNTDFVYLKKRHGFVRLALKHGAHIVPAFSFNESNTYEQFSLDKPWVNYIKRKFQAIFGLSLPLVKHVVPRRVQIVTVVGAPIPVPAIEDPTDEQVQMYLDRYTAALTELYDAHKDTYNVVKSKQLVIL